ncbi:hypothetical protein VNO77_21986 [Canavalia gladiata]|uniref:Uncharacterized protein n=1 Tax=Canavalia gladiata TaxID=3824 RepID=A0AAN9L6Y1_CANGL
MDTLLISVAFELIIGLCRHWCSVFKSYSSDIISLDQTASSKDDPRVIVFPEELPFLQEHISDFRDSIVNKQRCNL